MTWFESEMERDLFNEKNMEESEIQAAIEFIETRTEEHEGGEPPDEVIVMEGTGLSEDVVREAYERYWRSLG